MDSYAPAGRICAWPFVSLAGQVTSQIPSAALVALAASLLLGETGRRSACAAGGVLGLALLLRAHVLLSFPAFLVAMLVRAGNRTAPRERSLLAGSLSAGFIIGAAPRLLLDLVQTGSPLFAIRPQTLRAILLEGGLEAYRPDPARLLSIMLARPGFFLSAFARTYAFYLVALLIPLVPFLGILLRGRFDRRRVMASVALLCLIPAGVSLQPTPAIRLVIEVFPIAAAIVAAAVAVIGAGRGGRTLVAALALAIAAVFAIDLGLLADKYRWDLPETGLREALSRSGAAGSTVLVVPGIPVDQGIYVNAIRYRLRRVDARFQPAPPALGPDDLRRRGSPSPLFLLLVPILDTGQSVLVDRLMGRDRLVFLPRPPEAAGLSNRILFHDAASGVELVLVGGEESGAPSAIGEPDRR